MSINRNNFINLHNNLSILQAEQNYDSNISVNDFFNFPLSSNEVFLYNNLKYLERNRTNFITKDTSNLTENITEEEFNKVFNRNDSDYNNGNDLDENKENIYIITDKSHKKKQKNISFIINKREQPGKKRISVNSKKQKHGNNAFDNILSKIQIHYINYIREVSNDAIKAELKNLKKLEFKDIDYIYKRCIKFNYFEELKTIPIKDLLCKPITTKFKELSKNKHYNLDVYNKVINHSKWLKDFFEQNYISFFNKYYYNEGKELKAINFKGKEITFSPKTKSFYDLINNKNNIQLKKKLIECVETAYSS